MKLIQLEYFVAICKNNYNITRASEQLHVTQPCISSAIKELEDEYSIKLFYRNNKRMELTKEGEMFLASANVILNQTSQLANQMNTLLNNNKSLRLGISSMVGSRYVSKILSEYTRLNTQIAFDIEVSSSPNLVDMMEKDELDFAIINIHNSISYEVKNIAVKPLYRTEFVFCTSRENPLSRLQNINFKLLEKEPLILIRSKHEKDSIIKIRFAREGLSPNIVLYFEQLDTIKNFVRNNYASTFLFADMIYEEPDLIGIPLESREIATVGLVYRKNRFISNNEISFIEFATSICNNDIVLL